MSYTVANGVIYTKQGEPVLRFNSSAAAVEWLTGAGYIKDHGHWHRPRNRTTRKAA
jgi:hypothetical protein